MMPLIDLLRIAALLLASAGLCGAALVIASRLKLERFWAVPARPSPQTTIAHLADLADFARSGGLISIAAPAASMHIPLLSRGVNLLVEGRAVHEVREVLNRELDQSAPLMTRNQVSTCLGAVSFLALAAALTSTVVIAANGAATPPLLLGASLIFPAAFGLTLNAAAEVRTAASLPDRILLGTLAIETVCLIAAKKDGQAVRAHLLTLLPGSMPASIAAAA